MPTYNHQFINPHEIAVDNFAGGGGASQGARQAGLEIDIAINHDPDAIAMHQANHPNTIHYQEDVFQIDPKKACGGRPVGLAWFSPDCFPKGTLVLTRDYGYMPIETLKIGDYVLTHKNRWRKITERGVTKKPTLTLKGQGHHGLSVSKEHPFYTSKRSRKWNNSKRKYDILYSKPSWTTVSDIKIGQDYWGTPISIPQVTIPPIPKPNNRVRSFKITKELMYIIGLYLGNGWIRYETKTSNNKRSRGELILAVNKKKSEALFKKLNNCNNNHLQLTWYRRSCDTCDQIITGAINLVEWIVQEFGKGAQNKTLPSWVYGLDSSLKEALLKGYVETDGWTSSTKNKFFEITTISKKLVYSVKQLVTSLGYESSIYLNKNINNCIQGRIVNAKPSFSLRWRKSSVQIHTYDENNIKFSKIKHISEPTEKPQTVYNIGVEEDESYVVEGIVVHNCKHFSKAKGNVPVSKEIRGLAWVVLDWIKAVKPRVIMLENVEEFKDWGPLIETKNGLRPDPNKKGQTFQEFVEAIASHGYKIEWKELRACDYGAPTSRKRLFVIARCDGKPIIWPKPTHRDKKDLTHTERPTYRTAAECIDWSIPGNSIFGRKKPLVPNTLARIARGLKKFVIESDEPFIIPTPTGFESIHLGVNTSGHPGGSVNEPLKTITTGNHHNLIQTSWIKEDYGQSTGKSMNQPLSTITSQSTHHSLMTAFLVKHYGGNYSGAGIDLRDPMGTITAVDHHGLVEVELQHQAQIQPEIQQFLETYELPLTIKGRSAFLTTYYGSDTGQTLDQPLRTIPTKDRFGFVQIETEQYRIVDIKMRMLTAKELAKAQGVPDDYILDAQQNKKKLSETKQKARIGNMVVPQLAEHLIRANVPEMCRQEKQQKSS